MPAICAAHICRADQDASGVQAAEQRGRAANMVPRWVIVVEGVTQAEQVVSTRLSTAAFGDLGTSKFAHGIYRLQFDLVAAG